MRKFSFFAKLLVLVVAFGFLSAGAVVADELYARIRGTVTDATGASVPDVTITATDTGTGLSKSVNTASDGSFELLNLAPGTYILSATKTSFKTFNATGLNLVVNQVFTITIKLEIGATSEKVVVEATSAQVETTSMQLGFVVTGQQIVDMPLNGRNWTALQQLQPGVMASSDRFGTFATNGSQTQQNSFLINGTDSNDLPLNTPLVIPSPDAIGEFQLVTGTINPEYGRNSGGILNAVIKSGTNKFHGSGFDFFRDTSLNTVNYFSKKPSVFHQNQFGGTIGGPIWKDHTFGFFSYQGTRARQAQAGGNVPVFTAAQRGGAFGAGAFTCGVDSTAFTPSLNTPTLLAFAQQNCSRSAIPLFGDASSGCTVAGGTPCAPGSFYGNVVDTCASCASKGTALFSSGLWATGAIPVGNLNSVAVGLMNKFVPLPNSGTFFQFNPITTTTANQYLYRVDHTFSSKDAVWFYSFIQTNPSVDTLPFTGSTLPGFSENALRHIKQYTASWNHTFSGSTLNELRAGYTRFNFVAVNPVKPVLPSSVGFTGINPQAPSVAGVPTIAVTGLFTLGFTDNGPQPRKDQTYQLTDNFSRVMGKHALKFGFEGRRFNVGNPFFFENNGSYGFGGSGAFSTTNPGADFLLGLPDTYSQSSGGIIDAKAYQYYAYAQDQFKLRPNLTLTYGMGYQIDTPLTDQFNHNRAINCFTPFQKSTVFPTAPAGLNFPGDKGCPAAGYGTYYGHFGPRLGFAWSPNLGWVSGGPGKMSVRAGYGIYYNRSEEEVTLQNLLTPPFSLIDSGITDAPNFGSPSFIMPFTDVKCVNQTGGMIVGCSPSAGGAVSVANKYPFSPPQNSAQLAALGGFQFFEPFSLNVLDPRFNVPMSMNYQLSVERELPGKMIGSIGYVGAVARHLESVLELNPMNNGPACAADPNCVGARPFQAFSATGIANSNFDPTVFASIGQQNTSGTSNYNSLQASLNKAFSHGLSFLASYTYSHSLDFGSSFESAGFGGGLRGQNPFNRLANYGDSQFDARHRLVFSYTYNIPSIRNLHAFSGVPSRLTDGWRFAGITTFQGGFPVDIVDTGFRSLTCNAFTFYACWDVPNQVGPVTLANPRSNALGAGKHFFFTKSAFAKEALGTVGNVRRDFFHGPGINNWDFQFSKDTKITESTKIELRVELFNLWNHAQFNNPSSNINSSLFGRVTSAKASRLVQLAAKFYF